MRYLKVGALLFATLAGMRLASWALAWGLLRALRSKEPVAAVVSNSVACAGFILLLYLSLLPGEPMDFAAVVFGVVVFGIYTAWDLLRIRRKRNG
jgi:hypothetical protein